MSQDLRFPIIAGNWKMNQTPNQAREFIQELVPRLKNPRCTVVLCVPYVDLSIALQETRGTGILVGAQNCHSEAFGAFTGEVSAKMLAEMGVDYVILGHSERRRYFGETDTMVSKRAKAAVREGLKTIICVGESLEQREQKITKEVISIQTKIALSSITSSELSQVIIAYEPIWAIGTGKTASAHEANEVCSVIRGVIKELYDAQSSEKILIQYGGSMNAKNAKELLDQPEIDGGLIGGASLNILDFLEIIHCAGR